MPSAQTMQETISLILLIGTLLSLLLVLTGGGIYLYEYGGSPFMVPLQDNFHSMNFLGILKSAFSFTAFGFIQLGVLTLILTQVLRVGLLVWFYMRMQDYYFALISLLITVVLIISLIWQR